MRNTHLALASAFLAAFSAAVLPAAPRTAVALASNVMAIRWNDSLAREEFGELSTTTGDFTYRGTVGDLQNWGGQSFFNGSILYVLGNSTTSANLYSLNASTGALIHTVSLESDSYFLAGADQGGGLIAVRWNAAFSREEFGELDTTSGVFTYRGTVGDLLTWNGQSLLTGSTLYVIGNSAVAHNLYILDVNTGATTGTVNLGTGYSYFLAGADPDGNLIAVRWNAALTREEFGDLDTATGAFTYRGTVGDLRSWNGQSVILGSTLYVLGDSLTSSNLYLLDVMTGELLDTVPTVTTGPARNYFLAKRTSVRLFTDTPLIGGSSVIRGVHLNELRARVDALRVRAGLAAYPYADPALVEGVTLVRAQHIIDLRTAITEAYVATGLMPPTFIAPTLIGATISAAAVLELRDGVLAIE